MATTADHHPSSSETLSNDPLSQSLLPSPSNKSTMNEAVEAERRYSHYIFRQTTSILAGASAGVVLGVAHGSKLAALRFRAENAHRLPTSTKGWYLYHKSKNYVAMWAGLKEGGRSAAKMGFWAGAFVGVEESIDLLRRRDRNGNLKTASDGDMLSSVIAGLAVAGGFSAWNRFPLPTAARTARLGLVTGAAYGILQDAWRVATGRRVGYVEFVKRQFGKEGQHDGITGG